MNTSAPATAARSDPVTPSAFVCSASQSSSPDQPVAVAVHDALDVGHDDVAGAGLEQQLDDRGARRTRAGHDDPDVGDVLAHHAQRVVERGEHDDRGAVLVVVEHGDVEQLAEPTFHLEAARRGDVLEVDAREARAPPP